METCPPAGKRWSWGLRLVHWLDALAVLGLLATVLLRKTFLSYRTNGSLIREKLAGLNINIALEPAQAIARAIRAPMWNWHYVLGFALAALLLCRLFMLVVLREREILATSLLARNPSVGLRKRLARSLHVVYYLVVLVMVATGLMLYFKGGLGISKDFAGMLKGWHEALTVFFFVFVPLHLGGVVLAEMTREPGIVSAMIHGKRPDEPAAGKGGPPGSAA